MRFSLKWLLAGTVYVAISAAAFAKNTWLLADGLWLISFLAVGYAMLVSYHARGEQRASAIGFVLLSAMVISSVYLAPASLPTMRWAVSTLPKTGSTASITADSPAEFVSAEALGWSASGHIWLYCDPKLLAPRVRVVNSASTMAAGLVGAVLGTVAYRRGRVEHEGE